MGQVGPGPASHPSHHVTTGGPERGGSTVGGEPEPHPGLGTWKGQDGFGYSLSMEPSDSRGLRRPGLDLCAHARGHLLPWAPWGVWPGRGLQLHGACGAHWGCNEAKKAGLSWPSAPGEGPPQHEAGFLGRPNDLRNFLGPLQVGSQLQVCGLGVCRGGAGISGDSLLIQAVLALGVLSRSHPQPTLRTQAPEQRSSSWDPN